MKAIRAMQILLGLQLILLVVVLYLFFMSPDSTEIIMSLCIACCMFLLPMVGLLPIAVRQQKEI